MQRKEQLHEKAYRIAKTLSLEPRIAVELELAELGWTTLYTPLSYDEYDDPRETGRTSRRKTNRNYNN